MERQLSLLHINISKIFTKFNVQHSILKQKLFIKITILYKNFKHRSRLASQQDNDKYSQAGSEFNYLDFQSPLPLPQDKNQIPSNEEIDESLAQIQKQFPSLPKQKIISILYKNIIVPKIPSDKASSIGYSRARSVATKLEDRSQDFEDATVQKDFGQKRQNQIKRNLNDQGSNDRPEQGLKKQGKKKAKGQNENNLRKAEEWNKNDDDKEFNISAVKGGQKFHNKQQICAKSFCERGYGLNNLKDELYDLGQTINMDRDRYKQVASQFVHDSYRRLEQFLIQECGRNIKPLTSPEMRALYQILLNSQTKFQDDQYLTFRKFVKVTFDLGSVSIFEQAAIKLYIRIQMMLRGRIGTLRLDRQFINQFKPKKQLLRSPGRFQNQRFQVQSIWTAEIEGDLVKALAKGRTIAKARDIMRQKYGDNVILNNVKELKGRFFKIVRIAVKRLNQIYAQNAQKLPLLVSLSDQKIKTIIRCPEAIDARITLGILYKTFGYNHDVICNAIHACNAFCYSFQAKKQNLDSKKQPVISSVNDKIKHNINVSRKLLKVVTTPAQRQNVSCKDDLVYLHKQDPSYQHIVSLEHNDKLHYFRKTGTPNSKGGFQYEQKAPQLKRLEMQDGDDDSSQLVMLSDDD